jgi:hypothetical protein
MAINCEAQAKWQYDASNDNSSKKNINSSFIKNYYEKVKKKKQSVKKLKMLERIICLSCYFTFGLTGLILIMANFISDTLVSKETFLHTFQSITFGAMVSIFAFSASILTSITGVFINDTVMYQMINSLIYDNLLVIIFCVVSIFALLSLFGKNIYIPGIKEIAMKFIK